MAERGRLIDALGGEEGCRRLAASFYSRVATDPELRPLFPGKSMRCAIEEFSAFLVQFLGGDESKSQFRWWLGLRESHARFRITESQRIAWLRQMEATLLSSGLPRQTQDALLQFFVSSSSYVVGGNSGPVRDPELAERWNITQTLDGLVADIQAGRDASVLECYGAFASKPSIFVGILSRMLQTRRPGLVQAVSQAIERDPTLAHRQYTGRNLLHNAASAGCPEIAALLLRTGVDANVLDSGNHPPLYRLANECTADTGSEIVRILVDAGADVNLSTGATRTTPLHMAARRGNVAIAEALLNAGASPDARDAKGHTPLDRAINCRKQEVAQLLKAPRQRRSSTA